MLELVLIEITAVPAERSRGRHHPRVVKRKMSGFPTKARAKPPPPRIFRYAAQIRIVAPTAVAQPWVEPPITLPAVMPARRSRRAPPARGRCRPVWLEHVRAWRASGLARPTYCARHGLDPSAFHHWVARARSTFRPKHQPIS
jgi:hypothetical protein